MKYFSLTILACQLLISAFAQSAKNELFELLRKKDSLLFDIGFNQCDLGQTAKLVSENLEFYHDQGGITLGKKAFLESIRTGLCRDTANYRSRRELISGSLQVFPLASDGKLYGAIQMGEHRFFEKPKGQPERSASRAAAG